MPTLKEIRKRIRSIQSSQQITKTMQMVAASRFKKSADRLEEAAEYNKHIATFTRQIAEVAADLKDPLFEKREVRNVALAVITSDRGLCGSYNINIINKAEETINSYKGSDVNVKLVIVGKKGYDYFKNRDCDILKTFLNLSGKTDVSSIGQVTDFLTNSFLTGEVDEVYLLYTHYKSAMQYIPTLEKFLNIGSIQDVASTATVKLDYIFDPDIRTILNKLLPRYIKSTMASAISESFISENSARMIAMKNATDNAENIINDLRLIGNKARQAAITTEILEIVSGAEAMKKTIGR